MPFWGCSEWKFQLLPAAGLDIAHPNVRSSCLCLTNDYFEYPQMNVLTGTTWSRGSKGVQFSSCWQPLQSASQNRGSNQLIFVSHQTLADSHSFGIESIRFVLKMCLQGHQGKWVRCDMWKQWKYWNKLRWVAWSHFARGELPNLFLLHWDALFGISCVIYLSNSRVSTG